MFVVSRTNWCRTFVVLVAVCAAATGVAQQNPSEGRPDGRRGEPGGQGGPGGRGGFQFFGGGGGSGAIGLLQRNDVQDELELLDDQKKQIADLRDKSQQKMREVFGNLRGGGEGGDQRRDDLRETFRKFTEETQAEVDKILLPHQTKRLKQLEVQMQMRGRGVLGAFGGGEVADKLGISEEQRDKLREQAQGLENELRKKTAELRKQAQDQLLATLTDEQKKQFKELIGDPFEFKDEPGQGGFGGFGGGGGGGAPGGVRRGGDRPQE